ncbi:MAG: 50S ribosomal protein L11 methyltransferase [Bacteroidales bacterium]|nr:50S ribosomal protein L11 methyltransferase [Bacteroidales bacterium]
MNYIEVTLTPSPISEAVTDVLSAMLGDLGYDSFSADADCLRAYCPKNLYDEDALRDLLANFPLPDVAVQWSASEVQTQNWNEQWESANALTPIQFGQQTITIHPHMSFGSGHHETTSQLLDEILTLFNSRSGIDRVLDMGTGTGVLAIACALAGAEHVHAIEIDDWVADNARDNVLLNNVAGRVAVECGDASLLSDAPADRDLVLANINRNVLLSDMPAYVRCMANGATLLMSGFYEEDVPAIRSCAEGLGLRYIGHRSKNNWVVVRFDKN